MKLFKAVFLLSLLSSTTFAAIETEQELNEIASFFIEKIEPMARPLTNAKKPLHVEILWNKEYSETSAGGGFYFPKDQEGRVVRGVSVAGWIARMPVMTSDAMMFMLCHEFGHHLYGGAKEEEADYFAGYQCLSTVWGQTYSADRAIAAAQAVNSVRHWIWEERKILDPAQIKLLKECRLRLVVDSTLQIPFKRCK